MKSPFRSIRQTLFNEGKLLRYLGYAVGEIALIIIGILFALKINNMNEDRKAQAEFNEYLVQLKEDVKTTISEIRTEVERNYRYAESGADLVKLLEKREVKPEDLDVFHSGMRQLGYYGEIPLHVGLLGRLLEGDYGIIGRDKALARSAMKMEGRLENRAAIAENLEQRLIEYNTQRFRFYARSSERFDLDAKYDLDSLLGSKEFLLLAQNIVTTTESANGFWRRNLEDLESFLTVLEEYE